MMRVLGRDVAVTATIMGGSALGDAAAQVALVLRVHEGGGSVWSVTALLLAGNLPGVFLARPAGVLVDRHDSRVLIVGCALVQALVCLPLAVSSSIGVRAVLVAGLAVLTTVAGPACSALVPDMVDTQHLLRVNAMLRGATSIGRMAGWPLGGFLIGMLGSGSVLLLDAASFAVLAAGAMVIRTRRVPGRASGACPRGGVRVGVGGIVDPVLTLIAGSVGLVLLFVSTTNVVQVFFVKDVLGASDAGYGMVGACWMVGMVLAVPIMAPGRCTRAALASMVVASEAVTGVAVLGAGLSSSLVMVGVWYLLGGLGSSSMMVAGAALRQLVAPREARGRVLAAYSTLVNAAIVGALGLGVGLMSVLGARGVFLAAGALAVVAAVLAAGVLWNMGELELHVNEALGDKVG
jgi:MFS family permease